MIRVAYHSICTEKVGEIQAAFLRVAHLWPGILCHYVSHVLADVSWHPKG